jgi:hypothetical protein
MVPRPSADATAGMLRRSQEEAGIGCASGTQTEKTATSVQEAAPPHAHVRPISSPLAWGLAGVLLVSLFIKGYNVLVQSARRRKAEIEVRGCRVVALLAVRGQGLFRSPVPCCCASVSSEA